MSIERLRSPNVLTTIENCSVGASAAFVNDYCRIKSYINNLHPHSHPELYAIIEEITSCALPLWNRTLSSLLLDSRRIEYCRVDYYDFPEEEKPKQEPEENDNDFWDREHAEIVSLREKYIIFPEPAYTVSACDSSHAGESQI